MFVVKLTPQAEKAYLRLDPTTRTRVDRVLERFERGEFQHPNIRALKGELAGSLRIVWVNGASCFGWIMSKKWFGLKPLRPAQEHIVRDCGAKQWRCWGLWKLRFVGRR